MKKEIQPKPANVPPPAGRPVKRTPAVRFEISIPTMIRIIIVVACIWLLIRLWPIFLVLVVALLIVGTMSPAVRWMEARRIKRSLGIPILFTLLFVFAILVAVLTIPALVGQTSALVDQEPACRARIAEYLAGSKLTAPLAEWLKNLKYEASPNLIGATAITVSMRLFNIILYGASAVFLAIYILIDIDRLRGWLFAAVPRSHHIRLARVIMNLETIVGAYIRGQVITCLFITVFSFILLVACGVPHAMALAMLACVADILPYGAFLASIPMALSALTCGPGIAVIVLLTMSTYLAFEGHVLIPRIFGQAMRLPSSIVLFALLAGGALMGILGALLALPVAAMVVMLIEELRFDLPGQQDQVADTKQRVEDEQEEAEYERRTKGVPAEQAAAIAIAISNERRNLENRIPSEAVESSTLGTENRDQPNT
jgi:predicted PurR-regulated permease PerM